MGVDTFTIGGTGDTTVFGGQGNDVIGVSTTGTSVISGDLGDDAFTLTGTGALTVSGGAGIDTFSIGQTGGSASINGNMGADVFTFTATSTGAVTVHGGMGDDSIDASASTVTGGGFQLFGDNGNDTIVGGAGADTIDGGAGVDVLTGGAGQDTFSFVGQANASTQGDVITSFVVADDSFQFGGPAGSATNFTTIALTNASYDTALAQANVSADGTIAYVVATGVLADFDNNSATPAISGTVVFADTNADGTIDSAVRLTGVTGTIDFNDFVA